MVARQLEQGACELVLVLAYVCEQVRTIFIKGSFRVPHSRNSELRINNAKNVTMPIAVVVVVGRKDKKYLIYYVFFWQARSQTLSFLQEVGKTKTTMVLYCLSMYPIHSSYWYHEGSITTKYAINFIFILTAE